MKKQAVTNFDISEYEEEMLKSIAGLEDEITLNEIKRPRRTRNKRLKPMNNVHCHKNEMQYLNTHDNLNEKYEVINMDYVLETEEFLSWSREHYENDIVIGLPVHPVIGIPITNSFETNSHQNNINSFNNVNNASDTGNINI